MKSSTIIIGGLSIAVIVGTMAFSFNPFSDDVDFNTEIKPILNKHCVACHGGVKKAANLSFLFPHEALNTKGKSGKIAIIPGDAENSEFYKRLISSDIDERMPKNEEPLKTEEIQLLKKWIDNGAKWGEHWAYQKPEKPDVPSVGGFFARIGLFKDDETRFAKNEIDHFVLDKLKKEGLTHSSEAEKGTLLRRVYLDLTGLPPTEKQLQEFLQDESENSYEKVVDKLLSSSAYGERWAAMWLDLARYADTKGYERDVYRNIWRYRDYVIKAFNEDKPFDQFTIEQLAGDLLPNPTDNQLVATGFHRNTMTNDEGGTVDEEFRIAAQIDRVNTTFDVWQGTTMACVQCHTHPYDPFVHEEYYKSMAFFNNTRDEDVVSETPYLRFYKKEDSTKIQEIKRWLLSKTSTQKVNEFEKFVKVLEPKFNSHDIEQLSPVTSTLLDAKYLGLQHTGYGRLKNVTLTNKNRMLMTFNTGNEKGTLLIRDNALNGKVLLTIPIFKTRDTVMIYNLPKLEGKHDLYFVFTNPKTPKEWLQIKWVAFQETFTETPDYQSFESKYKEILNAKADYSPILIEGSGDLARKQHIFERGNWLVKGKEVKPDVPKYLSPMPKDYPKNRLGFAKWLVDGRNPLTSRVIVNRFWEQLFGAGIVETVEDFGTQGFSPTHPELLDYLAITFQEDMKWSVKKLLKMMVMSGTYRQSSEVTPNLLEKDPSNKLLARGPRIRLTAEQVRDQALLVSGLLSKKMYGKSVMPYQPDGLWQSPWSGESWNTSNGEDKHRRAIYTFWKRTSPYPSMMSFDAPTREFCQSRRLRTNTPLQALVTLNDPVYVEAAQELAKSMIKKGKSPEQQIQAGFNTIMMRDIDGKELEILTKLYRQTEQLYKKNPIEAYKFFGRSDTSPSLAAMAVTANAMMNLDEVVTKE
ncbi:protein of unknown function DUF1549 [Emticicia oligotrophica DSM 17448]|uniref:Cytochrome c domain-containing protein n=1 Tax=Emticicia oligotrophica (strain DSM 17448 / CIP 109782 / MTCC 6937 / GPTSA100-15) TaxID=929562 RepID=A0ABM5MXQ8_EMTOG|nr:DUF1553 domain-containing protein [Emticicia oligotrophica]AFK01873.1 protein of unknown function DUF1549 [Emticicia oligotrophica DSM 17448]